MDNLLNQMKMLLQLDWIYASEEAQSASGLNRLNTIEPSIVVPPAKEMEVLYRLARLGNMQRILEQTNYLIELDEQYRPFANQLRSLAQNYQSKAILSLMEQYLHSDRVLNQQE